MTSGDLNIDLTRKCFIEQFVDLSSYQTSFAFCRSDAWFLRSDRGPKSSPSPAQNRTFQSPPGIGFKRAHQPGNLSAGRASTREVFARGASARRARPERPSPNGISQRGLPPEGPPIINVSVRRGLRQMYIPLSEGPPPEISARKNSSQRGLHQGASARGASANGIPPYGPHTRRVSRH